MATSDTFGQNVLTYRQTWVIITRRHYVSLLTSNNSYHQESRAYCDDGTVWIIYVLLKSKNILLLIRFNRYSWKLKKYKSKFDLRRRLWNMTKYLQQLSKFIDYSCFKSILLTSNTHGFMLPQTHSDTHTHTHKSKF